MNPVRRSQLAFAQFCNRYMVDPHNMAMYLDTIDRVCELRDAYLQFRTELTKVRLYNEIDALKAIETKLPFEAGCNVGWSNGQSRPTIYHLPTSRTVELPE
jgi:hypothetical protein